MECGVCVGITDAERLRAALLVKHGLLGDAPDGPTLPRFDSLELAQGIERLLTQCAERGHTKATIHLDLIDAQALASALRKLSLMGY